MPNRAIDKPDFGNPSSILSNWIDWTTHPSGSRSKARKFVQSSLIDVRGKFGVALVRLAGSQTGIMARDEKALGKISAKSINSLVPFFGPGISKEAKAQIDAVMTMFDVVASRAGNPESGQLTSDPDELIDKPPKLLTTSHALGLDPRSDAYDFDKLWDALKNIDWTPVFMPPSGPILVDDGYAAKQTTLGARMGWRWGWLNELSTNCVLPGVGHTVAGGYEAFGLGIHESSPSVASFKNPKFSSFSAWTERPYSSAFGSLIWRLVNNPRQEMFRVHATKVMWDDFFLKARDEAKHLWDSSKGRSRVAARAIMHWLRWMDHAKHGILSNPISETRTPVYAGRYNKSSVGISSPGLDHLIDLFIGNLFTEQSKALDTLVCAYTPPTYAAFREPALAAKLDKNRRALLTNKAVLNVQTELIPDSEYRNAVINAQKLFSASGQLGAPSVANKPSLGYGVPYGGAAPSPGSTLGKQAVSSRPVKKKVPNPKEIPPDEGSQGPDQPIDVGEPGPPLPPVPKPPQVPPTSPKEPPPATGGDFPEPGAPKNPDAPTESNSAAVIAIGLATALAVVAMVRR